MGNEAINGSKLAEVRKYRIQELWQKIFDEGGFRGRTWGKRGKGVISEYAGSHILLGSINGEIVILTEKDGEVVIHEFKKTTGTELGEQVRNLLEENRGSKGND